MRFLSKQQTTVTPANLMKLKTRSLFLSLTVDTQLITSLDGSKHKDVRFYMPNTEMIDILRQLNTTSTETEKSWKGKKNLGQSHNGLCLSDG